MKFTSEVACMSALFVNTLNFPLFYIFRRRLTSNDFSVFPVISPVHVEVRNIDQGMIFCFLIDFFVKT